MYYAIIKISYLLGETERLVGEDETQTTLGKIIGKSLKDYLTLPDFVTNEEYQLEHDEAKCCYFSLFGIGPAWTW